MTETKQTNFLLRFLQGDSDVFPADPEIDSNDDKADPVSTVTGTPF
jgi:hypothetical protein